MNVKSLFNKIPYSLKMAILIVVITKVLVFSLGFAVTYLNEGPAQPLTVLMNQFSRWDSPHYIDIAKNGYVNTGEQRLFIVFFPLYPFLIRLITVNFDYVNLSALLVSNVSSIIAAVYLFKLAKLEFNDDVAVKAVLYLSVFPTAYFLSAVYTEGLFFALVIASIYYARLEKWPLAGFLGLLAALTRLSGLVLLPTLLVEYFHQKQWNPRRIDFKLVWTSLPLVGFLEYLNINNQVTGSFFTFMEIEKTHWDNSIDPLRGLVQAGQYAVTGVFPENITIGIAPIVFAVIGLLIVVAGSSFVYALPTTCTCFLLGC